MKKLKRPLIRYGKVLEIFIRDKELFALVGALITSTE